MPLARLGRRGLGVDPDTLEVDPDPTWSDALYYAVECQDYVYNAGRPTDADRLRRLPRRRRGRWAFPRPASARSLGDMPCLYWPTGRRRIPRPAAIVDPPYPTW